MNGIPTQGQKACGGAGLATARCPREAWHWVELLTVCSLLSTHTTCLSLLQGPPAVLFKGGYTTLGTDRTLHLILVPS